MTDSARVANELAAWLRPQQPAVVVTYLPLPGEVDLGGLQESLSGCEWALTRTPFDGPLSVHPFHSELEMHRFGFPQPAADAPLLADADVGIVLVPGLYFDRRGGRLGRGMGYYDGLLARLDAIAVGVCLDSWIIEDIPMESHGSGTPALTVLPNQRSDEDEAFTCAR